MLFNTWSFAIFASCAILIFAIVPARYRVYTLIFSGIVFYASAGAKYLLLMIGLTLITYAAGVSMLRARSRQRKLYLAIVGTIILIGVMCYFKYSHWVLSSLAALTPHHIDLRWGTLVLPLAISFFTFEFVHLIIEVQRGRITRLSLRDFAAFALFFPTMVAGPIKRYGLFIPQLGDLRLASGAQAQAAIYRIAVGLFKKLVIADSAHLFVEPIFHPDVGYTALANGIAMVAGAAMIYYDFSAYSDMAIGFAMLFGVGVPENFARPFLASNIVEFWHRWHMSLTSWVRDYVFVPLGRMLRGGETGRSNRSRVVAIAMSFLVMIIIGLWHGAGWHYAMWGLWNGFTLAAFYVWRQMLLPRLPIAAHGSAALVLSILLTDASFVVGMPLIGSPSTHDALIVYRSFL